MSTASALEVAILAGRLRERLDIRHVLARRAGPHGVQDLLERALRQAEL